MLSLNTLLAYLKGKNEGKYFHWSNVDEWQLLNDKCKTICSGHLSLSQVVAGGYFICQPTNVIAVC